MTHTSTPRSIDVTPPAALHQPGRAVVVEGRAGIGKSTVVRSIQNRLLDRGFLVVDITPGFDFATYRMAAGRPSAVPIGGGDDGPTLAQLLINHAGRQRLALVVDDVNELPGSSASHLRSLIHGLTDTINLVVSLRCERGTSDTMARLVDDIQQQMRAETVTLQPWTTGDLVSWSESEFGHPLSWSAATAIRIWTDGIPGWATVWLRNLHHRGLVALRGGFEYHLTTCLGSAAAVMAGTIDRHLNPISTPGWALMELVHRVGELELDQLHHLAPATDHDGPALVRTARDFIDTGMLLLDQDRHLRFANPLVGHLVGRRFPARAHRLQRLLDALVEADARRADAGLARSLCRLALDPRLHVAPTLLRDAARRIEPLDPELARAVTARLGSAGHSGVSGGPGPQLVDAIADPLGAVHRLLAVGRVADGQDVIDAVLADGPIGTLAERARSLRQLADVMAGRAGEAAGVDRVGPGGTVGWCRQALLHLRDPGAVPAPGPPPPGLRASADLGPLVDWLHGHLDGRPAVVRHDDLPADPLGQFTSFVEGGFADGAFLLVGLLGRLRPDGATRERFLCLVASSWVRDRADSHLSALLLDPFDQRIAALVAGGRTYAETAATLGIARHTVSNRLKVVYRTLGVNSRSELQAMAAQVA